MAHFAYLTPDAAAGAYTCRRLHIPVELIGHINAALLELTKDFHWEQFGTMTTEDAVELCKQMFREYIDSGDCMIGSIHAYAADLPTGVLPCDGSSHARVDYPVLYAMLDAAYIIDADNFRTPDLQGRVVIGAGSGAGLTTRLINDVGGEEGHQLTTGELPAHDHTTHQHGVDLDVEGPVGVPQPVTGYAFASVTGSTGSNQAHNTMQPFTALNYGIIAT